MAFYLRILTLILCFGLWLPYSAAAQVSAYIQENDDYFEKYSHESGLFRLLMPKGHQTASRTMRIGGDVSVYASEVTSVNDRRPIHNSVKSYTVKMTQTFGPAIDDDDLALFLDNVVKEYVDRYADKFGYLQKEERMIFEKRPGVELTIIYQDPELGEQGLRARIMFSDYSRLDVIFTGPTDMLFSNQTDRYFKSVEFFRGRVKSPGSFETEWRAKASSWDVFSALLPPVTDPYFPFEPVLKGGDRIEMMSTRFYDPVWHQFLFYNVHAYRFKAPIDANNAKKIIYSRHLQKFDVNVYKIRYKTVIEGRSEFFETASAIQPPPGYDYLNTIRIRGQVYDNTLLVQEIIAPEILLNTAFADGLLNMVDFHPLGAGKERPMDPQGVPDFITSPDRPEEKKMEESLIDILEKDKDKDKGKKK